LLLLLLLLLLLAIVDDGVSPSPQAVRRHKTRGHTIVVISVIAATATIRIQSAE
jgi:hypothetical protein